MFTFPRNTFGLAIARFGRIALFAIPLATVALLTSSGQASANEPEAWSGAVPRAVCGPGDRPETGLQGEVTLADRTSGAVYVGFNCNLELVGTFQGEGASFGFTWFKDCAYYGTGGGIGAPSPLQQHLGVVVLNVADPKNPKATAYLGDPAFLEPWESLRVNIKRRLLGGTRGLGLVLG
jgi:hypothetical protein